MLRELLLGPEIAVLVSPGSIGEIAFASRVQTVHEYNTSEVSRVEQWPQLRKYSIRCRGSAPSALGSYTTRRYSFWDSSAFNKDITLSKTLPEKGRERGKDK